MPAIEMAGTGGVVVVGAAVVVGASGVVVVGGCVVGGAAVVVGAGVVVVAATVVVGLVEAAVASGWVVVSWASPPQAPAIRSSAARSRRVRCFPCKRNILHDSGRMKRDRRVSRVGTCTTNPSSES